VLGVGRIDGPYKNDEPIEMDGDKRVWAT